MDIRIWTRNSAFETVGGSVASWVTTVRHEPLVSIAVHDSGEGYAYQVMTPAQARELAEALIVSAREAEGK